MELGIHKDDREEYARVLSRTVKLLEVGYWNALGHSARTAYDRLGVEFVHRER
jgi:hypothetical protein